MRSLSGLCLCPLSGLCLCPLSGLCLCPLSGLCLCPPSGLCLCPLSGLCVCPLSGLCVCPLSGHCCPFNVRSRTLPHIDAVPPLFRHFVDDAALFPPGNAPMAAAVPAHRALRSGPFEPLVGPFLCPASRVRELRGQLQDDDHLHLGLIVDKGIETVAAAAAEVGADPRLALAMVEVAVPPGTDVRAGAQRVIALAPTPARLFVELPRTDGWRDALDTIAAAGRGAKLRTGGLRRELFPSDSELAAFIGACAERAVAFKCTAGLHHAVRHTDPATSFHHHGFLNILVATCRATAGGSVQDAIAERDRAVLAAEARSVDDEVATAARHLFVSYGSCSIDDPVDDLRTLGLLPTGL